MSQEVIHPAYPTILHIIRANKKGVMVLPKLPYIWGEGGGFTPYKQTNQKLSINHINAWPGCVVSDYG